MPPQDPVPDRAYGALSALMYEIDDWCGTRPPHPFPPKKAALRDVLVAVAISRLAESISDGKVREQVQGIAGGVLSNGGRTF
jgi:hypothetical protein